MNLCPCCLRKLQWVSQVDLLDRYAQMLGALSSWYPEEAIWTCTRMAQIGMPTYTSLQSANPKRGAAGL